MSTVNTNLRTMPDSNRPKSWRILTLTGLLLALCYSSMPLHAQTNLLLIDYEWADTVNGPWTKPAESEVLVTPDGSLVTQATDAQKHFRLNVQRVEPGDFRRPEVRVEHLRRDTVDIADRLIRWIALNSETEEGEGRLGDDSTHDWTDARVSPVAYQIFDPSYRNGEEPAFVEFKVVGRLRGGKEPARFLEDSEVASAGDRGHILVSLHEGEAPVSEFNTEGSTPCEELMRRVGNAPNLKIMRFGPSFATVENEKGELLANAGADPFRIPADFIKHKDQTFSKEFDSETTDVLPPDGWGGPKMAVTPYASYEEFKEDYLNNPVYVEMRERKKRMVEKEWILERGGALPRMNEISVELGADVVILARETISRYFLDDDEGRDLPFAHIGPSREGGLIISGSELGAAPLTVETDAGVRQFWLSVVPPARGGTAFAGAGDGGGGGGGFTPGWQTPQVWNKAGGWSQQVRYYQTKSSKWCSKVGCGPVAWAMLFAWWDRHGVPATFYSNIPGDWDIQDAPFYISQAPSKIHKVYDDLHEYCDVICSPSGAGATPPGDMVEGGMSYLWLPKLIGKLGYSYSYSWDLMDPDWNQPSNVVRASVKNGRPAIVGLGWMWHYAVAYAYKYQEFKIQPNTPPLLVRRYFRCNEGWGKSSGAWYSGYDTFLGMTIKPWQK